MKELNFFEKEISLGGIEDRIKQIERQVERVKNDPFNGTGSGFGSDNLEFCKLFTWCKYDQYNHPQEDISGGVAPRTHSVKSDLELYYKDWLKNEFINFEFSKRSARDLTNSIIRLKRKCIKEEYLKLTISEFLNDFCNRLVELHPSFFKLSDFVLPAQSNNILNENAIDDLVSIYRIVFKGKTICSSVTEEEWIEFFVNGELPTKSIKLNFTTSVASLAFQYLADNYCTSSNKDFYFFIENSKVIDSFRNTPMTERNISGSFTRAHNDDTKAFREILKKL